jgi:regulator of protease activity HflC (stomatin/prohibitin superfamily)
MSFGGTLIHNVAPGPGRRDGLRTAGIVAAGIVVVAILLDPFHSVPAGYIGVKTEFGAVEHVQLDPGLHLVMPFISAIHDISVQPVTSSTEETAATHDQQNVTTRTAVTWSIVPAYADVVYADYRTNIALEGTIIAPIVANDMKAVISQYDAQELITERAKVASEIAAMIGGDLARHHVLISMGGVNITDMRFSEQYDQAIEAKQIAQQQALQARYTLEQTETSSQQQVVQAKAAADANVARAQGEAKATILQADADAQAYRAKEAALNPELLQLSAIQRWNGVLPSYMGGGTPVPFLSAGH